MKQKPKEKVDWERVGFGGNPIFEFKEAGDELVGEYQGSHEANNGSLIHTFVRGDEKTDCWGSGLLDKILSDEALTGKLLKIVYTGKKTLKMLIKGKNKIAKVRQYEVYRQVDL